MISVAKRAPNRRLSAFAAVVVLAGCSGGGTSPRTMAPVAGPVNGTLSLTLGAPPASHARRVKFLSPSAQSVSIAVTGIAAPVVADVSATSPACSGSPGARVCAIPLAAPVGTDTFTVTLYDGPNATGNQLGTGTAAQQVTTAGFSVAIGVSGIAAAIQVMALQSIFTAGQPATTSITVPAQDSDGNTITGAYAAPVTLTNSDATGAFTLSATTIPSSSQSVTLTYNGSAAITNATIGATSPGVPAGSVIPAILTVRPGAPTFSESAIPTANSGPYGISSGSDGAVWFTEFSAGKIGRISTTFAFSEYAIPTPASNPYGIVNGSDGNLWFTETHGMNIGRITTAGVVTEYAIPTPNSNPNGITAGPDGALWFAESNTNKIGRISTAGAFTEYGAPGGNPVEITSGPDGALWFVEYAGNKIGRITTSGSETEYNVPTAGGLPQDIASGPDGNLWFTEAGANKIGRITTAGVITEFPVPTANSVPQGIIAWTDGALWFTEGAGNKLGRITTTGTITEFAVPSPNADPLFITIGPDGALWFTENRANHIGRAH
jgi:virginiamycin B lyase